MSDVEGNLNSSTTAIAFLRTHTCTLFLSIAYALYAYFIQEGDVRSHLDF